MMAVLDRENVRKKSKTDPAGSVSALSDTTSAAEDWSYTDLQGIPILTKPIKQTADAWPDEMSEEKENKEKEKEPDWD